MEICYCLLAILGIAFLFLKKKSVGISFVSIAALLLTISLINTATQTYDIELSEEFLNQLSAINWENEEELLKLGFEKQGDEYVIFTDSENLGGITVTPKTVPEKCQKYKDIQYTATQSGLGKLEIKRLWENEVTVQRRYNIYINGMEIYAREDNSEGEKLEFEKFADYIGAK